MAEHNFLQQQEDNISIHIFTVSAAMVGVCITVLGLFSINQGLKKIAGFADELITLNSAFFLFSCVLSYMALRTPRNKRRYRLERIADSLFLMGLCFIVLINVMLVLEFIH